jgi:acetyl-CoA decarbonylase/synthase, CODH/ACS complex subunit delta
VAFAIPKVQYSGKINEVKLGPDKSLTVGGETSYPFFTFEGDMPHKPKIAMEIWDMDPADLWPEATRAPFEGVLGDPGAWAKKCVDYGADLILVQLKSTDPNADDKGAEEAKATVKAVLDAVDVPVAVYGVANKDKDIETLSAIAEAFQGKNLILGPVEDHNHKQIGAQALAYGHIIAANTPIDVNLAKQLNILLGNLGVSMDKVLIDPTTGGLGYGMEYCYSVMERLRMASLVQQDLNLQQPIINNMAGEVWKTKEAGQSVDEVPTMGFPDDRAILMEVTEAVSLLLAGADILVIRHPESVKIIKNYIDLLADGGAVTGDFKAVQKVPTDKLPEVEFTPAGPPVKEVKEAKPAAKAAPKTEAPKAAAAPKAEAPKAEAAPKPEEAPKKEAKPAVDDAEAKAKAEAEVKAKAEADAKAKAEAEVKAKAEAEAKAKADAEARKKAEEEAKKKAEADKAKAKAEEEEKLLQLRLAREKEREELMAKRAATKVKGEMKKADWVVASQYKVSMEIVAGLARAHKRPATDFKEMFPSKEEAA